MKKVRTAIIGIGFVGVAHVEALRRLGFVDIVAICDPIDADKKAASLSVDKHYADYQKMIQEESLDFVHICTPNNTHFDIASYAIKHKVNVVLEKPMTVSIDEAKELVSLAKEYGVVNAVNFHNRFYPATMYLRDYVQNNNLGEIISINGGYLQDWLLFQTDYSWRLNKKTSGITRAVADIGSHWFDLVEYITGLEISEVLADFKVVYPIRKKMKGKLETFQNADKNAEFDDIPIDTEDIATLLLRFSNGAIGNAMITQMFAGKRNKISVFIGGKESSVEWDLDDLNNIIIGHRDKPNEVITKDQGLMQGNAAHIIDYPAGHAEGFPDAFKQGFKNIYRHFLGFDEPHLYATFKTGLHQMELDEKIYQSAKMNQWIKVK